MGRTPAWILLVILALLIMPVPAEAQGDPAAEINQLAEQLHIQNMRWGRSTTWIGGNLGVPPRASTDIASGNRFPDWVFNDIHDESIQVTLADVSRPVVMNIWASWCGPCRFEFPFLTEYALRGDTNYDLWFVNANDTSLAAAQRFLREQATGITTYLDPDDNFIRSIRLGAFPTTVLMDTDGTIIASHTGIVTPTVMAFFDAVAANPRLGTIDPSTVELPSLLDHLGEIDPEAATPMVYGQQVADVLSDDQWRQDYRFEGQTGDEIIITMTFTDESLSAAPLLIGPDGNIVSIPNANIETNAAGVILHVTLSETGTYLVIVSRFLEEEGFGSGGFTLQIATAEQEANQGGNANSLTLGIPVSGRLTFESKQDSYLLDATAGQRLTFTLTHDTPEERLNLQVRLGAGETLVRYTGTENGELIIEAEVVTTGTYSVYVSRPQSSRVGPITYTLLVTDASASTDDNNTSPPTTDELVLNYGDSVTGSITDEVPIQNYTFEGTSGDVVTIEMSTNDGSLDTYLTLLDADGSILAENDDANLTTTNSVILELTLPSDGTYTVAATRFGGADGFTAGEYTLTLTLVSGTDNNPPPTTDTASLNYGDSVTGVINNESFERTYTFEGSAGDVVTIEMTAGTDGNLDTALFLLGPDSSEISSNDDFDLTTTNSKINEFALTESGTYTIVATRYEGENGFSSGDYTLTLVLVTGSTDDNNNNPPTTGDVLQYGDSVNGAISDIEYERRYTFEGTAGDVVTIDLVADENSNLDTFLALLGSENEELITNDDVDIASTNSRIEDFVLPTTGTYTIVAGRYQGETGLSTGDFTLSLTRSDESTPPVVTTDTELAYGSTAEGEITNSIFEIEFTFEGTAGDVVTIEMTATSGDLDPFIELYGPNGDILAGNDDIDIDAGNYNAAIVDFRLPVSGTYTIVASRFNSNEGTSTGEFALALSGSAGTPTVVDTADALLITYDETLTGTLTNNTPSILYTFEGTAGDVISITMTATSGDLDPTLDLLDADGNLLSSNDDIDLFGGNFNSAIENFELTTNGTYFISATRFEGDFGITTGDFELTLTSSATPPVVTPPTTNTELAYNESAVGTINSENYEIAYTFNGTQGDVVTIEVATTNGNLDTTLQLLGPNDQEVAFSDDIDLSTTNSAITEVTLPTTGTYTIIVSRYEGPNGLSEGEYTLSLTSGAQPPVVVNPPTTTSASVLNYGDVATGNIAEGNLDDRYVFTGEEGDIVTITMSTTSGDLDAYLSLIDENGVEIAFNDNDLKSPDQNAAIKRFKLPTSGSFTIVATRYGVFYGNSSGTYDLTLTIE